MSFAQVNIVGRLGKDPEVRMTQSGKQITSASVAVSHGKDKGSTWFEVAAWDNMGKWLIEAQKGDQVLVVGDLEQQVFTKKDGTAGSKLSVNARAIRTFSKREAQPQLQNMGQTPVKSVSDFDFDESIPF
jgi:single-strand DNA-binding protein